MQEGPLREASQAPAQAERDPRPQACVWSRTSKPDSVHWACSRSASPGAVTRAESRWLSTFCKRTLPVAWNMLEYAFSRLWPLKV